MARLQPEATSRPAGHAPSWELPTICSRTRHQLPSVFPRKLTPTQAPIPTVTDKCAHTHPPRTDSIFPHTHSDRVWRTHTNADTRAPLPPLTQALVLTVSLAHTHSPHTYTHVPGRLQQTITQRTAGERAVSGCGRPAPPRAPPRQPRRPQPLPAALSPEPPRPPRPRPEPLPAVKLQLQQGLGPLRVAM